MEQPCAVYSMSDGRRYLNNYRMGRRIGKGLYSNVRMGTDSSGERVAIKYYFKTMCSSQRAAIFFPNGEVETISVLEKVQKEISLHRSLNHKNIGKIIEVIDDEKHQVLYVVMEYYPSQCMTWDNTACAYSATCFRPFKTVPCTPNKMTVFTFSEGAARHLMGETVDGVAYLQSVNFVHKDIKPDNVMFSGYLPQAAVREVVLPPLISDYGMSAGNEPNDEEECQQDPMDDTASLGSTETTENLARQLASLECGRPEDVTVKIIDFNSSVCSPPPHHLIWDSEGTRLFTPPECLKVDRGDGVRGFPRDVWSLGCLLYCMIYGRTPFWATSPLGMIHEIGTCSLKLPTYVTASEELVDLLKGMLEKDPDKRMTLQQVKRHAWMTVQTDIRILNT
eukprot:GHVN01014491.1.p1 GENE.GHVN01014491.1~~GHVN01014491.1.p1  ORF type:complete len:393 (-),score=40.24 GHVN01014491.1:482-1660(-)